jgi:hypothetical protein
MKETFNVSEEEVDDFTGEGPWLISGETYTYIEDFLSKGDGECHDVIVQRARDGKFFSFSWCLSWNQNYHYEERWTEVRPEVVSVTKWV